MRKEDEIISYLLKIQGAETPEDIAALMLENDGEQISPAGEKILVCAAAVIAAKNILRDQGTQSIPLSKREIATLQHVANGLTEAQISAIMDITEYGVAKHLRVLRGKLKASTRPHAVAQAMRLGIIK